MKLAATKAKSFCPRVTASGSTMTSSVKLTMWATMCTMEKTTMDQATALWKVMFLSKGMKVLSGVLRSMEMKFRQTGRRMKATSTWRTRAAVRAIAALNVQGESRSQRGTGLEEEVARDLRKVIPKVARAVTELSLSW